MIKHTVAETLESVCEENAKLKETIEHIKRLCNFVRLYSPTARHILDLLK
jgi:hypothetical protein